MGRCRVWFGVLCPSWFRLEKQRWGAYLRACGPKIQNVVGAFWRESFFR